MKKNASLVKAVLVLIATAIVGYFGLNIQPEYIEEVIDQQLEVQTNKSEEVIVLKQESYPVVSVIDGDTFTLTIEGETQTVRVLGIDTPETIHSPSGAQCYGEEATNRARDLLMGASVSLQSDPTQSRTDAYDRVLAYVTLSDGSDFGEVLLAGGYAEEFTFKKPYQKQALYRQLEKQAQEEGRGLWGTGVCEG